MPEKQQIIDSPRATVTPSNEGQPVSGDQKKLEMTYQLVMGIVVVLFIGFAGMFVAVATMFVDAWNNKSNSDSALGEQVWQTNLKIDQLIHEGRSK